MKIIKSQNRNSSDWTQKFVQASQEKVASLSVEAGSVYCPLKGNVPASTLNCEMCNYCQGIELQASTMREFIKCSYNYESNVKVATKTDDIDEKFVTQHVSDREKAKDIDPEFFESEFKLGKKENDWTAEENAAMHGSRVVSSKDNDQEEYGGRMVASKYNNSIFDSEALLKLNEAGKQAEEDARVKAAELQAEKQERKAQWEQDHKIELDEIGYSPSTMTKNISGTHVADGDNVNEKVVASNNPDVSEYKFSIFDTNIQEKVDGIAEKTAGEQLKDQASQRKASIGRAEKESDWERVSKPTSVDSMTDNFFQSLFKDNQNSRVEAATRKASVKEEKAEEDANPNFGSAYDNFLSQIGIEE
jgi:hypothetical protein